MHTFAIHSYFCRVRFGVSWTDIFHVQLFEPHVYLLSTVMLRLADLLSTGLLQDMHLLHVLNSYTAQLLAP
eukprot:g77505.t1